VQETPEFRRSLSFASMETPAPSRRWRATHYSITLPDPSWRPTARRRTWRSSTSTPAADLGARAYPGHYVSSSACSVRGAVRKAFGCASFEGWAHYASSSTSRLRVDPPLPLRIHQLQLALVRICRYIVGIELHTRG